MKRLLFLLILLFGFCGVSEAQILYGDLTEACRAHILRSLNGPTGGNSSVESHTVLILVSKTFSGGGDNGCDLTSCLVAYGVRSSSGGNPSCAVRQCYFNVSSPSGGYDLKLTAPSEIYRFNFYTGSSGGSVISKHSTLNKAYSSSGEVRAKLEEYNTNLALLKEAHINGTWNTYYNYPRTYANIDMIDVDAVMAKDTDGGGVPDYAELLDQPGVGQIDYWYDDFTCNCGVCCVHKCSCGYYWTGDTCDESTDYFSGCSCHLFDNEADQCPCGACCSHSCQFIQTDPEYKKRHYKVFSGGPVWESEKKECDGTGKSPYGCACHRSCVCGAECFHCCICSYFNPRSCLGRFKDCSCHKTGQCPCGACCKCTCLCGDFPYECLETALDCDCHKEPESDNPCTCNAGCYHCCTCGEFAWDYSKCQTCLCHYQCPTCKAPCQHCCTCPNWYGPTCPGRAVDCSCHDVPPDDVCTCGACCSDKCTCGKWNGDSCSGFGSDHPNGCKCHDPNDCTCGACCSCNCVCDNWTREICPGVAGYCSCHNPSGHSKRDWFPPGTYETAYDEFSRTFREKTGFDLLFLFDVEGRNAEQLNFSIEYGDNYLGTGASGIKKFYFIRDIQSISEYSIFKLLRLVFLFFVVINVIFASISVVMGK